jgi:hypothetical protein
MKHFTKLLVITSFFVPLVSNAMAVGVCTAGSDCSIKPSSAVISAPSQTTPVSNQTTKITSVTQSSNDALLVRIQALENKVTRLEKMLNILGNIFGVKNLSSLVN